MYCSNCGAGATYGLKYCKRCGESLSAPTQVIEPMQPSRIVGAAWATAFATVLISLIGLAIVFISTHEMAGRPGVDTAIPMAMLAFGTLTVFGIVAMLVRLMSRFMGLPQAPGNPARLGRNNVTDAYTPAQIPAPPAAMPSVTEHTTRTFEHGRFKEPDAHE